MQMRDQQRKSFDNRRYMRDIERTNRFVELSMSRELASAPRYTSKLSGASRPADAGIAGLDTSSVPSGFSN